MEGGSRLRTPMGGVFDDLKMQKPPSLTPGTEASKTPWYHPDSVRTSPSWSDTLHSPVTRAKRNPLLGFRGFRLGGEFSKTQIGSHHPPILFRMLGLIPSTFWSFGVAAYYSSSLPLQLLFNDRLLSFRRGLLTRQFREHNEHAFDRPKQGITGEHHK